MMMRKLTNLVLTVSLVATVFGAASAETGHKPNNQNFAGAWYYPYIGPDFNGGSWSETGHPFHGAKWIKDYEGEVVYLDSARMQVKADGSGDILNFYLYKGETQWDPSWAGVREGSKVKVRSDDRHRARRVHAVPFYKWLRAQTK